MIRGRLRAITPVERAARSLLLCEKILSVIKAHSPKVIAVYASLPDEPDTSILIERLSKNYVVVLPRVCGDIMNFHMYESGAMQRGAYGIEEPQGDVAVLPESIDFIVVPGVAFSADGARIGRGKGYYDKYMSGSNFGAYKLGVCFTEQLIDGLPCEAHDIKVDGVLWV